MQPAVVPPRLLDTLSLAWFRHYHRLANQPSQNLGQSTIGRSLCRITAASIEDLMASFRHVDACYDHAPDTFIDLGCGRGLVCAGAALHVPQLSQVIGWDVNEREIDWANQNLIYGRVRSTTFHGAKVIGSLTAKLAFEVGNAIDFRLGRDACCVPELGTGVWIYAFWKDWGDDRRHVAQRLFLEDSHLWTVFACSDRQETLFKLIADGNEQHAEMLRESFMQVEQTSVRLTGSGERHSIYFYVKRVLLPESTLRPIYDHTDLVYYKPTGRPAGF